VAIVGEEGGEAGDATGIEVEVEEWPNFARPEGKSRAGGRRPPQAGMKGTSPNQQADIGTSSRLLGDGASKQAC
jgi:hypothetical protein